MKQLKFLLTTILIATLPAVSVPAQVANAETRHFEKDGLSFDFPAAWKLTDSSTDEVKYVTVAPEGSAVQIAVIVQGGSEPLCDGQAASKKITEALLVRTASRIHASTPLQTSPVKTRIGASEIEGVELHGLMNKRRVTTEVYSLRLHLQFVNLVYIRIDNDERGKSAWETIRTTLKIAPMVIFGVSTAPSKPGASITGGVLNGRALHLAQPTYPAIARQAHVSGTVLVQVLIDESGNVVSARAIEGHPLLQGVSVAAARESKFSPTKLCGEPVRVNGVIQYNFVAQ
jgi:TonB family protein